MRSKYSMLEKSITLLISSRNGFAATANVSSAASHYSTVGIDRYDLV